MSPGTRRGRRFLALPRPYLHREGHGVRWRSTQWDGEVAPGAAPDQHSGSIEPNVDMKWRHRAEPEGDGTRRKRLHGAIRKAAVQHDAGGTKTLPGKLVSQNI